MPGIKEIAQAFTHETIDINGALAHLAAVAKDSPVRADVMEDLLKDVENYGTAQHQDATRWSQAEALAARDAYAQADDPLSAQERTVNELKVARLVRQGQNKTTAAWYLDKAQTSEILGAYQESLVYAQAAEALGVNGAAEQAKGAQSMLDMRVPERKAAIGRRNQAFVDATVLQRAIAHDRVQKFNQVAEIAKQAGHPEIERQAKQRAAQANISAKVSSFVEMQERGTAYVEPGAWNARLVQLQSRR
jgi:hypothetical protein